MNAHFSYTLYMQHELYAIAYGTYIESCSGKEVRASLANYNYRLANLFTPDPVSVQPTVAKLKADQITACVQDVVKQLRAAKAAKNERDKNE